MRPQGSGITFVSHQFPKSVNVLVLGQPETGKRVPHTVLHPMAYASRRPILSPMG